MHFRERTDRTMINRGQFYGTVEDYVNATIGAFVVPIGNIESIKCRHKGSTGDCFIELIHEDGDARYFDATGMSLGSIGILVGHIIANRPIRCELRDREAIREVRRLFNH